MTYIGTDFGNSGRGQFKRYPYHFKNNYGSNWKKLERTKLVDKDSLLSSRLTFIYNFYMRKFIFFVTLRKLKIHFWYMIIIVNISSKVHSMIIFLAKCILDVLLQGFQEKLCFFSQFNATPLAYITVKDLQSSQRNTSVQSLLLAGCFLYNQ